MLACRISIKTRLISGFHKHGLRVRVDLSLDVFVFSTSASPVSRCGWVRRLVLMWQFKENPAISVYEVFWFVLFSFYEVDFVGLLWLLESVFLLLLLLSYGHSRWKMIYYINILGDCKLVVTEGGSYNT